MVNCASLIKAVLVSNINFQRLQLAELVHTYVLKANICEDYREIEKY